MTHFEYLEAYHELMTKALSQIAMGIAKGEDAWVSLCIAALQRKTDAMWAERLKTAHAEVAEKQAEREANV